MKRKLVSVEAQVEVLGYFIESIGVEKKNIKSVFAALLDSENIPIAEYSIAENVIISFFLVKDKPHFVLFWSNSRIIQKWCDEVKKKEVPIKDIFYVVRDAKKHYETEIAKK